jgi:acid phosphatase
VPDGKLPEPKLPPNDTNTPQAFFAYLTHREEPPAVAVALGLFEDTDPLPSDRRPTDRAWQTSRIIPFLGHIGLERLTCTSHNTSFVRAIANETPFPIPGCESGPGASCPTHDFYALMKRKEAAFGDIEKACGGLKGKSAD